MALLLIIAIVLNVHSVVSAFKRVPRVTRIAARIPSQLRSQTVIPSSRMLHSLKATNLDSISVGDSDDENFKVSRPNRIQDLQEKLATSGRAGLLAYGILNCFYYISVTAITCYFTMKKYPFRISSSATLAQRVQFILSRLGSVAGTVWVGSQITKIFRLSGAVICAPVVDNLMIKCQKYFKLPSRNAAFWFIVAVLWATVIVFYSSLVVYGTSSIYMSALESVL